MRLSLTDTIIFQAKADETLREFNLNLLPVDNMLATSSIGILKRGDDFKCTQYNNVFSFTDNTNYSLLYNFDYVESKNGNIQTNWLRQKEVDIMFSGT